ncbi:MAG: hypothetical protein JW982_14245 [Spirochaetes bacterium]|nr:hypothetical protein [Spirochaetota bacterium]
MGKLILKLFFLQIFLLILIFTAAGSGDGTIPGQEMFFNVSDFEEELVTYPETWQIDGNPVFTQGTWVIARFMLSVRVLFKGNPVSTDKPFAGKIAAAALQKGYRKNASMLNNYHDSYVIGDKIAVTLLACDNKFIPDGRMYNYTFNTSEFSGSGLSEPEPVFPAELSDFALRLQNDLTDALQKKNISNLEKMWDIQSQDKLNIFKNSLSTVYDYAVSIKSVSSVSVLYAGTKNGIKRYRLYFKIENSGKNNIAADLYSVIEVSVENNRLIYSIQFVIY